MLIWSLPSGAKCNNVESAIKCVRCGGVKRTCKNSSHTCNGAAIFTAIVIAWILDSDRFRWDCIQRSLSLGLQTAIGIAGGSYIWGFRCSDDNRWVYMCAQTCFAKYPPRTSKSLRTKRVCNPHRSDHLRIRNTWLTQRHTQHVHSIRCWDVTYISIFNYSIGICGYLFRGRDTFVWYAVYNDCRPIGNDGASRHYSGGPMACWQPENSEATGSRTVSANYMS